MSFIELQNHFDNLEAEYPFADMWDEIVDLYKEYLCDKGVRLPKERSSDQCKLVYLYIRNKQAAEDYAIVAKDDVGLYTYYQSDGEFALDSQVRHLKEDGWQIIHNNQTIPGTNIQVPKGYYCLYSLTDVREEWKVHKGHRRFDVLDDDDFTDIKASYDYKCATCEAYGLDTYEGDLIAYYNEECKLQQGHMDPSIPLSIDNCIPQCQKCNQSALDSYTFDADGFGYPLGNRGHENGDPWDKDKRETAILIQEQNNTGNSQLCKASFVLMVNNQEAASYRCFVDESSYPRCLHRFLDEPDSYFFQESDEAYVVFDDGTQLEAMVEAEYYEKSNDLNEYDIVVYA